MRPVIADPPMPVIDAGIAVREEVRKTQSRLKND
jgi:hypothetical protein